MAQKLSIVKIGGNVIENKEELSKFLTAFSKIAGLKILVHGGGKLATELGKKLGIESTLINGRRITDAQSLELITMVYGGLANKNIVSKLQGVNCNAIGLSGADANVIQAVKRPVKDINYGFAGDIVAVNSNAINTMLQNKWTPVFCALTHNKSGQLLNTNADTIASEIAIAMSSLYDTTLYYCFEKKGVLLDITNENSVVKKINTETYKELLDSKVIADGMLPKLENCFNALHKKVTTVCIGDVSMLDKNETLYTTITL